MFAVLLIVVVPVFVDQRPVVPTVVSVCTMEPPAPKEKSPAPTRMM